MSQNSKKVNAASRKKGGRRNSWLPVLLVLGGILLFSVAFLVFRQNDGTSPAGNPNSKPRLEVDKEKVDLGAVKLDQPVKVTFQLSNAGDSELRFSEPPYIEVVEGC